MPLSKDMVQGIGQVKSFKRMRNFVRSAVFLCLLVGSAGSVVAKNSELISGARNSIVEDFRARIFVGIDAAHFGTSLEFRSFDLFEMEALIDFPLSSGSQAEGRVFQGTVFFPLKNASSFYVAPEMGLGSHSGDLLFPVGARFFFPFHPVQLTLKTALMFGVETWTQDSHLRIEYFMSQSVQRSSTVGFEFSLSTRDALPSEFHARVMTGVHF